VFSNARTFNGYLEEVAESRHGDGVDAVFSAVAEPRCCAGGADDFHCVPQLH